MQMGRRKGGRARPKGLEFGLYIQQQMWSCSWKPDGSVDLYGPGCWYAILRSFHVFSFKAFYAWLHRPSTYAASTGLGIRDFSSWSSRCSHVIHTCYSAIQLPLKHRCRRPHPSLVQRDAHARHRSACGSGEKLRSSVAATIRPKHITAQVCLAKVTWWQQSLSQRNPSCYCSVSCIPKHGGRQQHRLIPN